MNKKVKKIGLALTMVAFLFIQTSPVLALEVNYPGIPGVGGGPGESFGTLGRFVQYIFVFIILSAGAIGIITIAIAGFQILTAFGSPAARGAANEKIRNAILGIILLVSSVLILRTVNPALITPRTGFAGLQPGVYLRYQVSVDENHPDGFQYKEAPDSLNDTSTLPSGTQLYYYCTTPGRDLLVWKYTKKDFFPDGNETTVRVPCNNDTKVTAPIMSYETRRIEPGVYFFASEDCTGYSSEVQKSSGDIRYFQEVKSIRIISGLRPDERYGVVLNREGGGLESGECSDPFIKDDPGEKCYKIEDVTGKRFNPFYAYIIKYNPGYVDFGSAGSNVKIYSNNLFARLDQQDSELWGGPDDQDYNIGKMYIYPKYATPPTNTVGNPEERNPDQLIREQYKWDNMVYTGSTVGDECCLKKDDDLDCSGPNPEYGIDHQNCVKGIEVNGSYYVFLYSRNTVSGTYMCQDFFHDWDDLPSQTDLLGENKVMYKFIIIPRR